jgi:hypothetical protein
MILSDHLGNEVAMVVDDGHLSRMVVIQVLGNLSLQHEVLVVELFHECVVLKFLSYIFSAKIILFLETAKQQ